MSVLSSPLLLLPLTNVPDSPILVPGGRSKLRFGGQDWHRVLSARTSLMARVGTWERVSDPGAQAVWAWAGRGAGRRIPLGFEDPWARGRGGEEQFAQLLLQS